MVVELNCVFFDHVKKKVMFNTSLLIIIIIHIIMK